MLFQRDYSNLRERFKVANAKIFTETGFEL